MAVLSSCRRCDVHARRGGGPQRLVGAPTGEEINPVGELFAEIFGSRREREGGQVLAEHVGTKERLAIDRHGSGRRIAGREGKSQGAARC
jgi:hypothetical protein